jgi:hypothetical protein
MQPSPSKNFLALNMSLVPAPKVAPAEEVSISKRENYGRVPEYLEARKAKWAAEEEVARREREIKAACPPGHRMMPEEERVETLALVTKSLEEAKKEVCAVVFSFLSFFFPTFLPPPPHPLPLPPR